MVGRLTVLCFAGTYALALASDLARGVIKPGIRWTATVALTSVGWVVHTAYLARLGYVEGELPVTTVFESLLVLAWTLTAVDLYLVARSPRSMAVGVFLLPVVLALVTVAGLWASRERWTGLAAGAASFWGLVHGVFLMLGAVATFVAFASGLMYLVQARRLKSKRPTRIGFTLPSLEHSERWNRAAITIAFPMLTLGLAIGVGLVAAKARVNGRPLAWTDAKILVTGATWLVFALLLNARFRHEMRGRSVMLLTILATAFLAFSWVGVDWLLPTSHGAPMLGRGR
jgi:ABC-type transport system involved in cytochrome c biogenesis permease subunit